MSSLSQWALAVFQWAGANPTTLVWLFGLSLLLFVASLVLIPVRITRMRADYFITPTPDEDTWLGQHPAARVTARIVKNLLGLILLVAGIAMMVLPGQGIITVLVALSLLEFPGKRALELRIIRQQHVHGAVNWIRQKAGQPPLELPG